MLVLKKTKVIARLRLLWRLPGLLKQRKQGHRSSRKLSLRARVTKSSALKPCKILRTSKGPPKDKLVVAMVLLMPS